jgi:hypothetical protein
MTSYCDQCDPKYFMIYGFCKKCRRKCECPIYETKSGMSISDYEAYQRNWYDNPLDSVLDSIHKQV